MFYFWNIKKRRHTKSDLKVRNKTQNEPLPSVIGGVTSEVLSVASVVSWIVIGTSVIVSVVVVVFVVLVAALLVVVVSSSRGRHPVET